MLHREVVVPLPEARLTAYIDGILDSIQWYSWMSVPTYRWKIMALDPPPHGRPFLENPSAPRVTTWATHRITRWLAVERFEHLCGFHCYPSGCSGCLFYPHCWFFRAEIIRMKCCFTKFTMIIVNLHLSRPAPSYTYTSTKFYPFLDFMDNYHLLSTCFYSDVFVMSYDVVLKHA